MDYIEMLTEYRDKEIEVFKKLNLEDVNQVMNVLEVTRMSGNRIFICGNGGSASTASHYAGDFNKGVNMGLLSIDSYAKSNTPTAEKISKADIPMYDFECLSDNQATMLAVANDEDYSEVFRFPLSVKMKEGDVVIGISGSGNSSNVLNAFDYAKNNGGKTIAITGYSGGKMREIADYNIHVDVNDMQITEDLHMVLDHMMMWVLCHRRN